MLRILGTALTALLLATPLAASAQEIPSYADAPQVASADEQIRGRIASFDGAYDLTISDERGFVDNVDLHDGTIINPTGLTLAPGMIVSILGYNDGSQFSANEIDTPYSYDSGVPYYGGHRWDYYSPSTSLTFFFGNLGWWHGNAFQGGYSYNGGARHYDDVNVSNIVRDSYSQHDGGSYRASGKVAAPRGNVSTLDRPVAPVQSQTAQRRNYSNEPRQVSANQSVVRQRVTTQPVARQAVVQQPVARQAAMQQPVARQVVVQQPARQAIVQQPVARQAVVQQPVVRQPMVHQSTASQVANRQGGPRENAPRAENDHDGGNRAH